MWALCKFLEQNSTHLQEESVSDGCCGTHRIRIWCSARSVAVDHDIMLLYDPPLEYPHVTSWLASNNPRYMRSFYFFTHHSVYFSQELAVTISVSLSVENTDLTGTGDWPTECLQEHNAATLLQATREFGQWTCHPHSPREPFTFLARPPGRGTFNPSVTICCQDGGEIARSNALA